MDDLVTQMGDIWGDFGLFLTIFQFFMENSKF